MQSSGDDASALLAKLTLFASAALVEGACGVCVRR